MGLINKTDEILISNLVDGYGTDVNLLTRLMEKLFNFKTTNYHYIFLGFVIAEKNKRSFVACHSN